MKHSTEIPKIYYRLKEKFGVSWDEGVVMAVGDSIHSKSQPSVDIEIHEVVHMMQQEREGSVDKWWDKYIEDTPFRLSQEVEAYKAQIDFLSDFVKDRNQLARDIHKIRTQLCGTMYGNMCTYSEAVKLLT